MLPVNDILLFIDVVSFKSFTAAARKNEMTPAAISKRISLLEASLGAELLKRTTCDLALTEAGKVLFENCHNLQLDLQNVIESVQETHKHPKGKIKISALQNISNLILAPLIDSFLQKYKDIDISINLDGALGSLPAIGEYDLAFRSGRQIDSSAVSRLLFSHNYIVCASPVYLSRNGSPKKLDDLKLHNCIDCRHGLKGEENLWTFYEGKEQYNIEVKGNIYTDNALLIKNLALNHCAIIYSPSFIVAEDINAKRLTPLLIQYKTIENPIYIIHPYTNRNAPKRVKTFIEFILANINVPTIRNEFLQTKSVVV